MKQAEGSGMSTSEPGLISQLLTDWKNGDEEALQMLIPLVYGDLRRLARGYLRRERTDHTLNSAALVHEAYLKLADQQRIDWQNRAHFLGIAAQLMRRILVDHARKRLADKRKRGVHVTFEKALDLPAKGDWDLIALEDGLKALEKLAPELSRIVELRFFGGLSIEETSEVLGVSSGKIKRDWTLARAWLHRESRR